MCSWRNAGGFYTLHHTEGDWCVVRKNMIPRKRYQYWNDVRNVENELRNWMRQHKSLNRLPKHRELTETGQFALSRAVIKHGGISAFVSRLHVPCYSKRKKQEGYWQDVANVEKELRDWMQRHDCKKFPTRDALRETGDSALASALRWHGNTEVMAKRLNVRGKQRGRHFWTKDENLKKELLPYLTKVLSAFWISLDIDGSRWSRPRMVLCFQHSASCKTHSEMICWGPLCDAEVSTKWLSVLDVLYGRQAKDDDVHVAKRNRPKGSALDSIFPSCIQGHPLCSD